MKSGQKKKKKREKVSNITFLLYLKGEKKYRFYSEDIYELLCVQQSYVIKLS